MQIQLAHVAFVLILLVGTTSSGKQPSAQQLQFFESKVRPLLATHCYKCHGPKKQNAKLRLDAIDTILIGGESGPALVRGKPDASLLIEAINYESLEMPPSGKLKDEQIAVLTEWVRMGAPWPAGDTVAQSKSRETITDKDREYWAFQPVRDSMPPRVNDANWCRNDVDQFILRRLEAEGLQPAPEASAVALLRRVYFDLVGLPPSPEDLDKWISRLTAPQREARSTNDGTASELPVGARLNEKAYAELIDELLDDPRYGERWARHWLDLVRYAESDGYKQDAYRPHAWRYRDYVIRSLNEDKPYDQFVMEQLAGDEIAPNDPDAIAATGFLRHWIYEYNQRDVRTQWDTILNDVTDVTSDVFLAMGMGCARCHDHKFDPILQRDYYRLKAFFAPMTPRDDLPLGTREQLVEYHAKMDEWKAKTAKIRREIDEIEHPHRQRVANPQINKFPPDIRPMMRKRAADRKPLENQLAELVMRQVREQYAKLDVESKLKGDEKTRYQELKKQLAEFESLKPKPLSPAFTVTDIGDRAPATIIPGDGKETDVLPGFPTVMNPANAIVEPTSNSTGRRTALARWICDADNPLTTRVIVNRIWQYHFGSGLVATSSDFGRLGEPPSHPALLDWLTRRLLEGGWRLKKLHRLIMLSATYRQSAVPTTPQSETRNPKLIDPGNRLLWKMNTHRLDAEQIRDAMLAVSGELNAAKGGPSADGTSPRRTIYTKVIRNRRDPILDVFDAPDNFNSTSERNVTTTPNQSLLMINGDWTMDRAQAMASRLQRQQLDRPGTIDLAYRIVYGRPPTSDETASASAFIDAQFERASSERKPPNVPRVQQMPSGKSKAASLRPSSKQPKLHVSDSDSLPSGDFTIEAIIVLDTLYPDASVRTVAAQWDGNTSHAGWSLGVTSTKSAYQPRNLILQFVGDPKLGGAGYEVVASNLRPELKKPYYVAASVKIADMSEQGITFFMKDLSSPDSSLQTASVGHKVTGHYRSKVDFTIGGRDKTTRHSWDGLIDEVRLSGESLTAEQLLVKKPKDPANVVGHWRFEDAPGFFADSSSAKNNVRQTTEKDIDPLTAAWIDFCHVLLNSNEFLYVD